MKDAAIDAIRRAAIEHGIDPAYALAVAERENDRFDPAARNSKTILGIYQMSGKLRGKYGGDRADSLDPFDQATAWGRFQPDLRREMSGVLGRDPSDPESYLGHHFGGRRAARMMQDDPERSVYDYFTPEELRINPHIGKAGTIGRLSETITADISRRMQKYGGESAPDFAQFGELLEQQPELGTTRAPQTAAASVDFSQFGDLVS